MPVEIKELIVRVTVDPASGGPPPRPAEPAQDREAIVAECVEQVLEILREKEER